MLLFGAEFGEHLLGGGLGDSVVQGQHLGDDVEIFGRTGRDTGLDQEVLELVVAAQWLEAGEWDRLGGTERDVGLLVEAEVAGSGFVAEDAGALEVRKLLVDRKGALDVERGLHWVDVEGLEGFQGEELLFGELGRRRRDDGELLERLAEGFDLFDVGVSREDRLEVDGFLERKLLFHGDGDGFAG